MGLKNYYKFKILSIVPMCRGPSRVIKRSVKGTYRSTEGFPKIQITKLTKSILETLR